MIEQSCITKTSKSIELLNNVLARLCRVCDDCEKIENKTAAKVETEKNKCISKRV